MKNVSITSADQRHEALVRFLTLVASRLNAFDLEELKRKIIQVQVSPSSTGPLIDFMTFVNPDLPREEMDAMTSAILTNAAAFMSDKSKRLSPDIVKLGPPLGSPATKFAFSQGDIEALAPHKEEFPAILELHSKRAEINKFFADNPSLQKYIVQFASILYRALLDHAEEKSDIMQSMVDHTSRLNKTKTYPVRPNQSVKLTSDLKIKKIVPNETNHLGEGALPVAAVVTAAKAGQTILDIVSFIYMSLSLLKMFNANEKDESGAKLRNISESADLVSSILQKIEKLATSEQIKKLKDISKRIEGETAQAKTSPYNTSVATEWSREFYMQAVKKLYADTTRYLQQELAKRHYQVTKQKDIYDFLTPPPTMPAEFLMSTIWDSDLIKDEKMVFEDVKAYNGMVGKYDASTQITTFDENFKQKLFNGGSSFLPEVNWKNGWDNVIDLYLKEVYVPQMVRLTDNVRILMNNSNEFGRFASLYTPHASISKVFAGLKPVIPSWNKAEMDALKAKMADIHKGEVAKLNQNTVKQEKEDVKKEDVPVLDPKPEDIPINPVRVDTEPGTVIVTPNEVIVNMGQYTDPNSGIVNDYNDLYVLGKTIHDLKSTAKLQYRIPTQYPLYGDVEYEGSLLAMAVPALLKVGKKILSSKGVQKLLSSKKQGLLSKILPRIGDKAKTELNKIAEKNATDEVRAASDIASLAKTPSSPTEIISMISTVQTLAPAIKGINEKLDSAIELINKVNLTITSHDQFMRAAMSGNDPQKVGTLISSSVSPVDAILATENLPQILPFATAAQEAAEEVVIGDIDLWKVII